MVIQKNFVYYFTIIYYKRHCGWLSKLLSDYIMYLFGNLVGFRISLAVFRAKALQNCDY